jgi:YqaJ-like viral recombinase domain
MTPEHAKARLGKLTASRVCDAFARTKSGWGASRANLMASLIVERLTGERQDTYQNAAMLYGIEGEDEARAAYEFHYDVTAERCEFIDHPRIAMAGASPDGLVGDDGLVEFKVPNSSTHIETLLSGTIPGKYIDQMTWQLACTGRKWCHWVSFDPRMPEDLRLFVKRFQPAPEDIAAMEKAAAEFLAELDTKLAALHKLTLKAAA